MRRYDNLEYPDGLIKQEVNKNLQLVVVIPAYNEKDLLQTIESLYKNTFENAIVEIIVLINQSETASGELTAFHQKQHMQLQRLSNNSSDNNIRLYPLFIKDIPDKIAGVGLARKIGMDEAYRRLELAGNEKGIIACLDGDTRVQTNYLQTLLSEAVTSNKIKAYSIYFEHDLQSAAQDERYAIIQYELHLRYYINMQRLLGLPFAYYTIGSAMAVRSYAYAEAFGMNKRQAGEDFYFLHKYIKTGYFREINETTVMPAARISDRVPFGTGKALAKIIESRSILRTYNYRSFIILEDLLSNLQLLYEDYDKAEAMLKKPLQEFLSIQNFDLRYQEIKRHTKDFIGFRKRFFRWFDAFMLMKYLHYARDKYYANIAITDAVDFLFDKMSLSCPATLEEKLHVLRERDKAIFPWNKP